MIKRIPLLNPFKTTDKYWCLCCARYVKTVKGITKCPICRKQKLVDARTVDTIKK